MTGETFEMPDAEAMASAEAEGMTDRTEPGAPGDLEFRKAQSGIYGVWLTTGDTSRRVGTVGKVAEGEWRAYSSTGHPSSAHYPSRQAAGEALAANRRK